MKKILVIGSGGAGKSTFSVRLHKATGIELIHLDRQFWQPNWAKLDKAEWNRKLENLSANNSWIMDGNYDSSLETRLRKCDTVFFLDPPRLVCLWRIVKRTLKYYRRTRPDMAEGCRERFDWEFVRWIWNYPKADKIKVETVLKKYQDKINLIHLKSPREVEKFLVDLELNKVR